MKKYKTKPPVRKGEYKYEAKEVNELILEGKICKYENGLSVRKTDSSSYIVITEELEKYFVIGEQVFVSYFISDKPINYKDAETGMVLMSCGLIDQVGYYYQYFSELTGSSLNENFVVGGHNVLEILQEHEYEYLVLRVYNRKAIIDSILEDLNELKN